MQPHCQLEQNRVQTPVVPTQQDLLPACNVSISFKTFVAHSDIRGCVYICKYPSPLSVIPVSWISLCLFCGPLVLHCFSLSAFWKFGFGSLLVLCTFSLDNPGHTAGFYYHTCAVDTYLLDSVEQLRHGVHLSPRSVPSASVTAVAEDTT